MSCLQDNYELPINLLLNNTLKHCWKVRCSSCWRHQMETFSALLAFYEGNHRWPVVSLTKGSDAELWCFLCAWTNGRSNNRDAGGLRRHRSHYDVTVMMVNYSCSHTIDINLVAFMLNKHCLGLSLSMGFNDQSSALLASYTRKPPQMREAFPDHDVMSYSFVFCSLGTSGPESAGAVTLGLL